MLKTVIFNIEFTLSFSKPSYNKLEILLILNFDLSEKIGKQLPTQWVLGVFCNLTALILS